MRHIGTAAGLALLFSAGCHQQDEPEVIGPRGGMVVSDDGRFTLEIPPGALEGYAEVSVKAVDCSLAQALPPCYVVEPRGLGFLVPAVVTVELGDMELDAIDPQKLHVIVQRDEGWNILADQVLNLDDEILSASAMYLSSYAIVVLP